MTLKVVGVPTMPGVCQPVYSVSQELVCPGIISGFNMSIDSGIITIGKGSAFVKVKDSNGVYFMIKVYNSEDITLTATNSSDVIIKVPIANVQNAQENYGDATALDNIATIEVVPENSEDTYEFILKLANINASGNIQNINNSGIKLGDSCQSCIKCNDGVVELGDANGDFTGSFSGDGSLLTGIDGSNVIIPKKSINVSFPNSAGVFTITHGLGIKPSVILCDMNFMKWNNSFIKVTSSTSSVSQQHYMKEEDYFFSSTGALANELSPDYTMFRTYKIIDIGVNTIDIEITNPGFVQDAIFTFIC